MQHRRKKHALRNVFLSVILLIVLGGAAYGMTKYRSVKNSVNNSFTPSGVTKERNVSGQLKNKKPISILLMGTDTGALGRDYKGRTDSMMVITLNPSENKTTVTSIPRDTAVNIPGYKSVSPAKINAAYSYGQTKT
ncbi:LCP family protein, partial [Companilactobacillus paralimentarius]